jgi:hypothetical protein
MVRLDEFKVFEPIVLQCVPDYLDVVAVQVKIVTTVCGWVWANSHGVIIGSEYQEIPLNFFELLFYVDWCLLLRLSCLLLFLPQICVRRVFAKMFFVVNFLLRYRHIK